MVEPGSRLVRIADADEINVVASEEPAVSGWICIDADGEDCEVGAVVLKLKERGHLLDAGRAPGGPEIQENDAAAVIGQMNRSGTVGDGEVRGNFAGLAGVSATVAARHNEERGQRDQSE